MKKVFFILLLFVMVKNKNQAQETKKDNKFFSSQISAGIVEGDQNTSFHVEILNGIRYKTWFGGIGTGLDYYYFRSIPVYLSAAKYLSPRNHSFFVQGDAGMNFAWEEEPRFGGWNEISNEFKPGLYWNGSIGFATGLDRKNSFSFGLGYSQKNLRQIRELTVMCFNPPCENTFETYKYNLKRLTLRIGWQFNYSR